jgi:hypothetical protein
MVPSGFVHQGQLDAEIKSAVSKLGPEVIHVAYQVREDSTGEPSIFFRIVLPDAIFKEEALADVTRSISELVVDEVTPIKNWGLHPYFNFRSQSEQQRRPDPERE